MKGKTKKTHLRIKTPRKLHQAQDPGFQIKTLHLVVDIHIYIYVCMSRPTPNKNFKFSCRHTYICMYVCMSRPTPEASLSVFLRFWGCWFFLLYSRIKASTPNWMLRLGDLLQRWSFSRPRGERERKPSPHFFPVGEFLAFSSCTCLIGYS